MVEEKISELVFKIRSIGDKAKERITAKDRLDKYREGIKLNSQTTSNILDERHPLTWMAEDDEFAEQIDTTSKYLEEEPMEPHPIAMGKSGGVRTVFMR